MINYRDFIKKLKGIILEPSKAFETSKDEKFGSVVKYYFCLIGLAVIFSIIIALWLLIKYAAIEFFAYSLIKI